MNTKIFSVFLYSTTNDEEYEYKKKKENLDV